MDVIVEIIQTVGFPTACCVFLGYYIKRLSDEYRSDVKEITEKYNTSIKDMTKEHTDNTKEFRKTLERNTLVLTEIGAKLERIRDNGTTENSVL